MGVVFMGIIFVIVGSVWLMVMIDDGFVVVIVIFKKGMFLGLIVLIW